MAFSENGRQPKGARAFVQAWRTPVWVVPAWARQARLVVLVCLGCAGGCSNYHTTGPEAWWHETIGGKIAEQRPPPPGDNDAYPNLATVPAKPPPPNTAAWNEMTAGLITDRIKADQAAALAPIPAPASGAAAFGPEARGQPSPGQEQGASAALVAVTPPQATPATSPTAKPPQAGAVQTGSSGGPATASPGAVVAGAPASGQPLPTASPVGANPASGQAAASASGPAGTPAAELSAAERVANGQLPPLPTREPPRPGIAPAPPPPLVPLTAAPPAAVPANPGGTAVDFDRGSAALNDPALAEVKALAAVRGDHGIAVTGYGDATSSDPLAQAAAIGLGLSRAQALATALVARGVPYAMLRLNAESAGRGASLRLLQ